METSQDCSGGLISKQHPIILLLQEAQHKTEVSQKPVLRCCLVGIIIIGGLKDYHWSCW